MASAAAAAAPAAAAPAASTTKKVEPVTHYGTYPNNQELKVPPHSDRTTNLFIDEDAMNINRTAVNARTRMYQQTLTQRRSWIYKLQFTEPQPSQEEEEAAAAAAPAAAAASSSSASRRPVRPARRRRDPPLEYSICFLQQEDDDDATSTVTPTGGSDGDGDVDMPDAVSDEDRVVIEKWRVIHDALKVLRGVENRHRVYTTASTVSSRPDAGLGDVAEPSSPVITQETQLLRMLNGMTVERKRTVLAALARLDPLTKLKDDSAKQNDVVEPIPFATGESSDRPPPGAGDPIKFIDDLRGNDDVIIRVTKTKFPTVGVAVDTVVQYALCSKEDIGPTLYGACIFKETGNLFGVILVVKKLASAADAPLDPANASSHIVEATVRSSGIVFALEKASRVGLIYADCKLGNFMKERGDLALPGYKSDDKPQAVADAPAAAAAGMSDVAKLQAQKAQKEKARKDAIANFGKRKQPSKNKKLDISDDVRHNMRLIDMDGIYSFIVPLDANTKLGFKPVWFLNMTFYAFSTRNEDNVLGKLAYNSFSLDTQTLYSSFTATSGVEVVETTSYFERLKIMGAHLSQSSANGDTSAQLRMLKFDWRGGRFGIAETTERIQRKRAPNDEIDQLRGTSSFESMRVDSAGLFDVDHYLQAISIGLRAQMDFRAIEYPRQFISDRIFELFDLTWMFMVEGQFETQTFLADMLSRMQMAQRLVFVERHKKIQSFVGDTIPLAKECLSRSGSRTFIDILRIVNDMRGYKPAVGETPAPITFKQEDAVAVRERKANNRAPFCVNNEREYWGSEMFTLLYGNVVTGNDPVT